MSRTTRRSLLRVAPTLALLAVLAARGVDGEPETPTRSAALPTALTGAVTAR
jgi:hypothetical protein